MKRFNKKGDIFSILIILIILFAAAMLIILLSHLNLNFITAFQDSGMLKDVPLASNSTEDLRGMVVPSGESMIFFLFLAGFIALMITAVATDFNPTIIFFFILLSLIVVVVAAGFTNIFKGATEDSTLSSTASQFSILNIVFSKYTPLIFLVICAIILVIMYSKSRNAEMGAV